MLNYSVISRKPYEISVIYYFYSKIETNNEDEAYYLCAILNSSVIDNIIKPVQALDNYILSIYKQVSKKFSKVTLDTFLKK